MTTFLIESNEKLTIKQMEFELKSRKLELESPTQACATWLIIAQMFKDILRASN
jgi:hypothetical protein